MMQIWLNDKAHHVESAVDLSSLIEELTLPSESVAIAIDGQVVPRSQWPQTPLTDGLKLTVFQAIAGG